MPRQIEQLIVTGTVTASWTAHRFVGVPSRCRLTTLRIVYTGMDASTSFMKMSLGEDNADNKYPIYGHENKSDDSLELSVSTVGCMVVNLDHDYVADEAADDSIPLSLSLWLTRVGGADCTFTAYLIYAES